MPPDPLEDRWIDGGPFYAETTDLGRTIVEPWNAASAFTFVLLAAWWAWRLRGRHRLYPFLCCCLPPLAAGGLGGTLYHALRSSRLFFLLDVVPILLLGLSVSLYLWVRLNLRWWYAALLVLLYGVGSRLLFRLGLPQHQAINLSYASLALLILLPLAVVLARSRLRHVGWAALALASFAAALFFRHADLAWQPPLLPMGTHWLWHLLGAAATAALAEYLYRLGPAPAAPS